jgi:YD repeat-containing protein
MASSKIVPLSLPEADSFVSYNLDYVGNWVDQENGGLSEGPAVQFITHCVAGEESRSANAVNEAFFESGPTLEYDLKGNLVTYGDLTLTYDAFNRLTAITGTNQWGNPVDVAYVYDALGRRVQRASGSESIDYVLFWAGRSWRNA